MTTCACAGGCGGTNYPLLTSKERDTETGLDYFLARYYSSTHGRFTSPDEFAGGPDELFDFAEDASHNPTFYADLEQPQSLNKYHYCYNNPLAYVDHDGHSPDKKPLSDKKDLVKLELELERLRDWTTAQQLNSPWVIKARHRSRTPERNRNPPNFGRTRGRRGNVGKGDGSWRNGLVTVGGNWVVGRDARPVPIPGGWNHKHHLFPQRADLAARFARRNIDINEFLMVLPEHVHRELHRGGARGGAWNREWETFFRANQNPTRDQIFQHMVKLIGKYNLGIYPVVPK